MTIVPEVPTRDRLLIAAADLLEAAGGGDISTRAICERAGVQAPALYHHFGSKDALLDEVVSHGFRRFLERELAVEERDPVDAVRFGWDAHVRFGAEFPAFYLHIYGRARQGQPCGVVEEVAEMILRTLGPVADAGRLAVSPREAAAELLAASSGVILAIITAQVPDSGEAVSVRIREAVLAAVLAPGGGTGLVGRHPDGTTAQGGEGAIGSVHAEWTDAGLGAAPVPRLAQALAAAVEREGASLGPAETVLLQQWLRQLAAAAPGEAV